jgi:CHRD domain
MRRILLLVSAMAAIGAAVVSTGAAQVASDAAPTTGTTTFTTSLTGPGGTGTAVLTLNPGGKVCYVIEVTLTTAGDVPREPAPGLGNAHIHALPAGAIAVDLTTTFQSLGDATFVASGCVRADKDVVRDILLNPDQYYLNVHTVAFPGGAVRGALG